MVCWQFAVTLSCFFAGAEPAQVSPDVIQNVAPPLPVPMPAPPVGGFNEYCQEVANRLEHDMQQKAQPTPSEVADFVQQGRQACASGHIRSGMHWLRVARTMLHDH